MLRKLLNIARRRNIILIGLSIIAFLLSGISDLVTGPIMGVGPMGFSSASSNFALIAIALAVCADGETSSG